MNRKNEYNVYVKNKQPAGYKLIEHPANMQFSKTTSVDKDTIVMYVRWKKK